MATRPLPACRELPQDGVRLRELFTDLAQQRQLSTDVEDSPDMQLAPRRRMRRGASCPSATTQLVGRRLLVATYCRSSTSGVPVPANGNVCWAVLLAAWVTRADTLPVPSGTVRALTSAGAFFFCNVPPT